MLPEVYQFTLFVIMMLYFIKCKKTQQQQNQWDIGITYQPSGFFNGHIWPLKNRHISVVAKHCRENIHTTWKWLDKRPVCPRIEPRHQVTVPPPQSDWQMLLSTRQLEHDKSCPLFILQSQERWWHFQLITNQFLTYGIYCTSSWLVTYCKFTSSSPS